MRVRSRALSTGLGALLQLAQQHIWVGRSRAVETVGKPAGRSGSNQTPGEPHMLTGALLCPLVSICKVGP